MHRHDADFIPLFFGEVALDLDLAGDEPMQEPLQRRHMLALVGEGEGEEFLDRVVGVVAQAFEHRAPPALGAEDVGVKLVGRHEIGAPPQFAQHFERAVELRIGSGAALQACP